MRVLITGINGFVGIHLANFLLAKRGLKIHGISRPISQKTRTQKLSKKITLHAGDMLDRQGVERILKKVRPNLVFHLAAQSFVPASWDSPADTLINNVNGQLNLLEALRKLKLHARVQIAGSSEIYGNVESCEIPLKETAPFRPLSPYGVSKATQDLLGYQYYQSYEMDLVRTRAFSHTGPGQSDIFAASNFAKQIAWIEARKQSPVIHVGNLEAIRDFTDVRDMAKAYWLALEKGKAGEAYNISSGVGRSIRKMVEFYLRQCKVKVRVKQDKARMRPSDVPILVGDNQKFCKRTGWTSLITFEKTLTDLLNYWRQTVGR